MAYIDFIEKIHKKTKRDYLGERVLGVDKAQCAKISKQFGRDYWDGDRKYGYGGYNYDGRYKVVARDIINHYKLAQDAKILDLGCGKGYLLYEFTQLLRHSTVRGIDISQYAVEKAKEEVKPFITHGNILELPFETDEFDMVIAINVLHNLYIYELWNAVSEIERVGANKYIVVDSYRNEEERANLMYWQLTCECFYTPQEWEWILNKCGYKGEFSCIYYE